MKRFFFLGLDLAVVIFSLWLQDRVRVRLARRLGDPEAASRQQSAENPFARVDWIGSVLLPAFMLLRSLPVLGWVRPLELDLEKLRRPCRDGLLIALSGPAVSLLLAMAGGGLVIGLGATGMFPSGPLGNLLISFCLVNAMLVVFNLLPIPPLAGASAVELFLDGDALTAFEEIKPYGFLLLLAGAYLNFFDFLTQPVTRLVYSLLGF